MKPKLSLVVCRAGGLWRIDAILEGSQFRNGKYTAMFDGSKVAMVSTTHETYKLDISARVATMTEAVDFVVDYFDRHGCL